MVEVLVSHVKAVNLESRSQFLLRKMSKFLRRRTIDSASISNRSIILQGERFDFQNASLPSLATRNKGGKDMRG